MGPTTTAADLDTGWSDALDLAGRLHGGRPLPRLELGALAEGEHATLEASATYAERSMGQHRGHGPAWVDEARADLVVTTLRILVGHPERGVLSLWHVDLEHLHLEHLPFEQNHLAEDHRDLQHEQAHQASLGRGGEGGEWRLDLHPVGINPRVRLTGRAIPVVALHLAHTAFPTTWSRLSGLLPLLEQAA